MSRILTSVPEPVTAEETCVVHDPALGIYRKIFAGQPVPPDLVEAYHARTGETGLETGAGQSAKADEDLAENGPPPAPTEEDAKAVATAQAGVPEGKAPGEQVDVAPAKTPKGRGR